MSALYERHQHRGVTSPVLLLATDSWVDAGIGAGTAIAHVLASIPTEPVATFDSDRLLDYRARRPTVRIVDGVASGLTWPEIQLRVGADPLGADVVMLTGPEPDLAWHAFIAAVVELTTALGVRLVVGLGAHPAPVPHTRPVQLTAIASDAELAAKIGVVAGTIEVPAGIQTALQAGIAEAGVPAIEVWARVPHYLATMPYPPVGAALVSALGEVSGLQVAPDELEIAAGRTVYDIDALIAGNDELREVVRRLEVMFDSEAGSVTPECLPSGDELAAEFQRYLRGQPGGGA